ncbi:MAG: hypothetical protein ACE366_26560 [Bradymonadia bacterium]
MRAAWTDAHTTTEQAPNGELLTHEVELTDPDQCHGLTRTQSVLLTRFAQRAHALVAPWGSQRETTELRFDAHDLESILADTIMKFAQLADSSRSDGTNDNLLQHPEARARVKALLSEGYFIQYIREIRVFNQSSLEGYFSLLDLKHTPIMHMYEISSVLEATVDQKGYSGSIQVHTIKYTNEMGMHWTANILMPTVGISLSLEQVLGHLTGGAVPPAVKMPSPSLSPGSGLIPEEAGPFVSNLGKGHAQSMAYFAPSFFSGAIVYMPEVSAELGLKYSALANADFHNNGKNLNFDTRGWSVAIADSMPTPNATLGIKVGTALISDPPSTLGGMPEATPQPKPEIATDWQLFGQATVQFQTNKVELTSSAQQALNTLCEKIYEAVRANPGIQFQAETIGSASQKYRTSSSDAERLRLNEKLAAERAAHTRDYLATRLPKEHNVLAGQVFSAVDQDETLWIKAPEGTSPDDNRSEDKQAIVRVWSQGCTSPVPKRAHEGKR